MRKSNGKISNPKEKKREKRRLTIRKKIVGSLERPRVCATKSNKHISVQVIDDTISKSLFTVSTFSLDGDLSCNIASAKIVGLKVAEKLKSNNLTTVVFDRAGYKYTGVVEALVNSIREAGIQV